MISTALVRSVTAICALSATAVFTLGPDAWPSLIDGGLMLLAVVGAAFVLRDRVEKLRKEYDEFKKGTDEWKEQRDRDTARWREEHNRIHTQQATMLERLNVLAEASHQRLVMLENHREK